MKFASRPSLLQNEPGAIARNPVRVNSFELEAGAMGAFKVKVAVGGAPVALEPAQLRRILGSARDSLKQELGEFQVFGTQVVSAKGSSRSVQTVVDFENRAHSLSLEPIATADASQQKELILNNLFNRAQARSRFTQIGRKFFDVGSKQQVDPELKLSVVTGYSSAVHVQVDATSGAERVLLEVDTTQKVYFDQNVLQSMNDMRARLGGDSNLQNALLAKLRNRQVITEYENSRAYRVVDIDFNLSPASTFQLARKGAEPRDVSYADYLQERYGYKLSTTRQPMLVAEVKRGRGGKVDRVQLVPESCRETGLNDELRAGGFMMKLMKFKPRPDERIRKQQEFLQRVFTEQSELFNAWGIRLRRRSDRAELSGLDAGRIPPGRVTFGATSHDLASRSMFDREAQSGVYSAPTAFRWAILSLQDDRENVGAKNTFVKEFQAACQRASVNVDQPVMQECPRNAQQWLEHMRNLRNADFLLLILPARGRKKDDLNLYKLTKRLAIAELGVPTQCVLHKTLTNPKGVTSIVSKILTQVVSKLNNGAAWGLVAPDCVDVPTMVCGVDVWHGAGKSLLGFTASLDACFSKQTSEARQQALKEELSAEVAACVLAACEAFNTLNQTQPARILVQRDGVSEGQFQTVLNQEVAAILDALAKKRVDAKLTYVIVSKRVDAKVLDARKDDGCQEGTVVDSLITRRDLYDFQIVPLYSRNGLANPVHYAVLHDGSQEDPRRSIRPSALYSLTYKLCFMYYNWTGPVRAPAPCMFAHKLAYLLGDLQDKDNAYLPTPKLMSTVSCWQL